MTKELVKIANLLDSSKLHNEANSLTKIAEDMMDDNFDPMVYDSDEEASDDLDAQADDFDNLMNTLMDAERNGDLNDEDISSIMNILNQESGRSTIQMSYDDLEDMEDTEDVEDDMGPEEDEFDYDSPEEGEDMEDDDFPVQYDEMMAELSKRRKSGPYSGLD
jgi:hypothetical protein